MKRLITIAVFACLFHFCQAQTNYYFADNERNYWQEDSTSVNIIVADLEQYDMIVDRTLEMFSDKTDTVSFVKDDDVEGGDADYAQFHAMKAELRDGEMVNWRDMTEAQKAELQEIAEHNSGRASEMAKGVLCFYHGICLEDGDLSAEEPQGGTKSAKTAINKADNAGLYVYPNPTDGDLNVEITDGTQITAITLCDLQGRVVETQNFASLHGGTTVITMQNIPAWVYILTVTDLNGVIYHQKIIKK